jgi:hypothetical protein
MKSRLLLTLCICVALVGCAEKPTTGEAELRALLPAWFDTLNLIKASPRVAIPPQIAQMQAMRRQAEAIHVSECMKKPKKIFVDYMQSKIDMITDVLSEKQPYLNGFNSPVTDFVEFQAAVQECVAKP